MSSVYQGRSSGVGVVDGMYSVYIIIANAGCHYTYTRLNVSLPIVAAWLSFCLSHCFTPARAFDTVAVWASLSRQIFNSINVYSLMVHMTEILICWLIPRQWWQALVPMLTWAHSIALHDVTEYFATYTLSMQLHINRIQITPWHGSTLISETIWRMNVKTFTSSWLVTLMPPWIGSGDGFRLVLSGQPDSVTKEIFLALEKGYYRYDTLSREDLVRIRRSFARFNAFCF